MLIDILYNFYDFINNTLADTFTEILCESSFFSDAEINNLVKYVSVINTSHNLHIALEHLDIDHITLVCSDEMYLCVYKIRDYLYVTKLSYEKSHKSVKTLSELYDVITMMAISKKLKKK